MDDLWQLRAACVNRSSSQRFSLAASTNQTDMSAEQFSHPYVAQEVCVVERTVRQESVPANMLNFVPQGMTAKASKPDIGNSLLALISGSPQQHRPSIQQTLPSRSAYLASNPQLYQMNTPNLQDVGRWSMPGSTNLACFNRAGGFEIAGIGGLDMGRAAAGQDIAQVTRTAPCQDNFDSAFLRLTGSDMFKPALPMTGSNNVADVESQPQFPSWLADSASCRRTQRMHGIQRPSLQKSGLPIFDAALGFTNEEPSVTPKSRLRVYCTSYSGSLVGGELILTDGGHLVVLCLCHNIHMSVAKFCEHAGVYTVNPGSVVHMESGETLVQWRKAFFSHFGVKVPEDHVGWEWNDINGSEVAHVKYKAVVTQCWQNEVDLSYQGEPSIIKSRITEVRDASNRSGKQGFSTMGAVSSNTCHKTFHDPREIHLKNFGRPFRTNAGHDIALNELLLQNSHESIARKQETTLNGSLSSDFGGPPVGGYIDFINNGTQQYITGIEHQVVSGTKNIQAGIGLKGWNNRHEPLQVEKENLTSNFELRLGQPSQQTSSICSSLSVPFDSRAPNADKDRNKSLVYDKVLQQGSVWDSNIQQSMANSAPGGLSNAVCSFRQSRQGGYNGDRYNEYQRTGGVDLGGAGHGNNGSETWLHPLRHFDDGGGVSSLLPGHRCAGSFDHSNNNNPSTATYTMKPIIAAQVRESRTGDEGGHLQTINFDAGIHEIHVKNPDSLVSGNVLAPFHCRNSVLCMRDSDGNHSVENNIVNAVESCLPLNVGVPKKNCLSLKGAAKVDVSSMEPVVEKKAIKQTAVSNYGTCEMSQNLWLRKGLLGMTSLGLTSSNSNLPLIQSNANKCRTPELLKSPDRAMIGDGNEQHMSEDLLRNLLTGNNRVQDGLPSASEPFIKPCVSQEQWRVLGTSVEKNNPSEVMHDAIIDNTLEKNMVSADAVQGRGNSPLKDSDACDLEVATGEVYDNSFKLQTDVLQLRCGQQKDYIIGADSLTGTKQCNDCNCSNSSKVSSLARALPDEPVSVGIPGNVTTFGAPVEELFADTAAKRASVFPAGSRSPTNEHPLCSENLLSEFSDGGHITDDDACIAESAGKELMRNDVVDEGSGIGKCCSSDEIVMGARTKFNHNSTSVDARAWESPSSCDTKVLHKSKYGHKITKLQGAKIALEGTDVGCKAVLGPYLVEKRKRKTLKWKRLHVGSPSRDRNYFEPIQTANRDADKTTQECFLSGEDKLSGRKGVMSAMTYVEKSLKKRRSLPKIGHPCKSFRKGSDVDGDQYPNDTGRPEQRLQVKGQKLIIKFSQNVSGKQTRRGGHVESDKVSAVFRKQERRLNSEATRPSSVVNTGSETSYPGNTLAAASPFGADKKPKYLSVMNATDIKNTRNPLRRQTPKATRMVSLSSIMKLPPVDTGSGIKVPKLSPSNSPTDFIVSEKVETKRAVAPAFKEKDSSFLKACRNADFLAKPKDPIIATSSKEVRKRSLSELTVKEKHQQSDTHMDRQGEGLKSFIQRPIVKDISLQSKQGGCVNLKKSCMVPRAERSVRLKLKCGNMISSVGGSNAGTSIVVHKVNQIEDMVCNTDKTESVTKQLRAPLMKSGFIVKMDRGTVHKSQWNRSMHGAAVASKKRDAAEISAVQVGRGSNNDDKQAGQLARSGKKQKVYESMIKVGKQSDNRQHSTFGSYTIEWFKDCRKKRSCELAFKEDTKTSSPKKTWKRLRSSGPQDLIRTSCCVCGSSSSEIINRLLQCKRCSVQVHQACYGVSKIPKSSWTCRPCKVHAEDVVCVLCGYGGGALTRAKKTRGIAKGLLQVWKEKADAKDRFNCRCSVITRILGENTDTGCTARGIEEPLQCQSKKGSAIFNPPFLTKPCFGRHLPESSLCESVKLEECELYASSSRKSHPKTWSFKAKGLPRGDCLANLTSNQYRVHNSMTAAVHDPNVTQWVHMVCALWMPGTRCLNVGTMAAFDVSGVAIGRRRLVCSICKRSGGACIQCRAPKCSTPFHPWCAHEKGLLQSENVGDDGEKVGFFGRCLVHGGANEEAEMTLPVALTAAVFSLEREESTCARTEGFKGRPSLAEYRVAIKRQLSESSSMVVSQEQIAAWLRINERKTCTRRFFKPPNSDLKTDHREYLRFKQEQGWKRLAVYKSGIHALGLYTAEFISKGEMVAEYIGEIVGLRVADKREADYHSGKRLQYKGACYLFRIDMENIIDATRKGGIARFVNHSCSPNCVAKVICVKNQNKVVFFAERDIYAGEEITYDYKFNYEKDSKIPCFCNSKNCRGYLN